MDTGHFYFNTGGGNMLLMGTGDSTRPGSRPFFKMEESSNKRPFFSCSDELVEEKYYDEQLPEKKRRLTSEQVQLLEKSFEMENKLEPERKTQLARKLGLKPRQVAVWFQNRRARWKTKHLERDYEFLKASYDSLLSDYDTVIKENEKLKSEVVFLNDTLQTQEFAGMESKVTSDHPSFSDEGVVDITTVQFNVKVEDHGSSGSSGSAIVDDKYLRCRDSVDSYFPSNNYSNYVGPVNGVQSEEDDLSDESRSYFSDVFAAAADQSHQQENETVGWWFWS